MRGTLRTLVIAVGARGANSTGFERVPIQNTELSGQGWISRGWISRMEVHSVTRLSRWCTAPMLDAGDSPQ